MARIKRFLLDETATAEATSIIIMIAAVGLLLTVGLVIWYGGLNTFFRGAAGQVDRYGPPTGS